MVVTSAASNPLTGSLKVTVYATDAALVGVVPTGVADATAGAVRSVVTLAASKAAPGAGPLNASVADDPLRRSTRVPSVTVPDPEATVTV